jgi:hypothetical protein
MTDPQFLVWELICVGRGVELLQGRHGGGSRGQLG